MKPEYVENGSIYMTRYKNFLKSNNRVSGKTKLNIINKVEIF